MKPSEPQHKTQMEIFHELEGHAPQFLVSASTPAPMLLPVKLGPNLWAMSCVFLHRFEPFASPRESRLVWSFICN